MTAATAAAGVSLRLCTYSISTNNTTVCGTQFSWSVPSDLTGTVTLGCPHCSGHAGQRAVDLSALLSHPLEEHERTGTTAIARLHP